MTHKFESRYIDALVGGNIKNEPKLFKERSPIHHLERLKSPLIIFQGGDDKIVPPQEFSGNGKNSHRKRDPKSIYQI
ncbi:MAG: hypothetical protein GF311_20085 [Candidatus Lokiarchaeota archaeon]|nr:hypothetical protein [Candidatus Lokiarchaeota archaeon]